MKKNRNGFTLVELLLVIAILAIVVAITIPMVASITDSSRRKAFYLYGINLLSKGSEKYISEYTDLDDLTLDEFNQASCVVYDIQKDLDIKNTGNYEGWVRVKRTEPECVTSKVAVVHLAVNPAPTKEQNEEYYTNNHKYIDGIMYPKYCITSGDTCTPDIPVTVQEYQYSLDVMKKVNEGETLCASYEKYNKSTEKFEVAQKSCKKFEKKAPEPNEKCAKYTNEEDLLTVPQDYTYEVTLAYKDNNFAMQNINMESITEDTFKNKLEESINERAGKSYTQALEIYKPSCDPNNVEGFDRSIVLGTRGEIIEKVTEIKEPEEEKEIMLDSLTISGYDIGFNSGQTSYSLEVPNSVTSVSVNAVPHDSSTTVTYDKEVNLAIGRNVISIYLESANGKSNRYVVYINRLNSNTTRTTVSTTTTTRSTMSKSTVVYTTRSITTKPGAPDPTLPESNTQLEFLTISKHQDFEFDPDIYYYDLKLDKDEDMLYLNYRAKNPNATVIVTGNSNLKNGSQVEILVRSENEYYTNSYIINVYREGSTINYTLLFRILAIVLGIILAVVLIWLTLTRRSMRPKKGKQIQVITKTTQTGQSTSVFDSQPKKVVVNTNQNNNDNNNPN